MAKQALGKGLGALIKTPVKTKNSQSAENESSAEIDESAVGGGERVNRVPLERIVPSPFQPRKHFNDERLDVGDFHVEVLWATSSSMSMRYIWRPFPAWAESMVMI